MTELIRLDTVGAGISEERLTHALVAFWSALESPQTRRAYAEDWKRFCAFLSTVGAEPLAAGPAFVGEYMERLRARGLARATRARALSVLREVYAAIYRTGLRPDNPAREFKLPRVDKLPRTPWLSEEVLIALLRPQGDSWEAKRDRLVLFILIGLALRRASAAGVQVDDLRRLSNGRLVLHVRGKGGKEADVLVPIWLAGEIESWIAFSGVTGPLFPRLRRVGYDDVRPEMNRAIGPDKVYEIVKVAAARAGIDKGQATPHALRRSLVTLARVRGVALDDLQAALMHARITTTEGYDKALRAMKNAPGDVLADIYAAATERSSPDE